MSKKIKVALIINMLIILVSCMAYAMMISVISIASVAAKYFTSASLVADDFNLLNKTFNWGIVVEFGMFAVIELLNYISFLTKIKRFQISLMIISSFLALLSVIDFITKKYISTSFIYLVPIISSIIYYKVNQEKKPKKIIKKEKKAINK